ncbi:MAG: CoA-transferase [Firmicutes bacterium]|nr:CoA-transferase [Bacillota bacterium]
MGGKKVVSLKEAVQEIRDRDVLFLGSFIDVRRPMAAAYEIVRQRKRGLILLAQSSLAEDLLVGAGCAAAWRGCYTGMASFGLSPATRRKIEEGVFLPDEIGHLDIILGAMAAMAGSPFVATRATLGSDVLNPALSRTETINRMAGRADVIPRRKFVLMEDPFYGLGLVKLQPAMRADVAVFHVPVAGEEGTSRIGGSLGFDHYFIHAARRVIVTAEQVVPEEYLRRDPNRNQIPSTSVDMVVEVPWGGHPSQVPGCYDLDVPFIQEYVAAARSEEGFSRWVESWIDQVESRDDYLNKLGASRLQGLRAIPPYGYRPRRRSEQPDKDF